MRQPNGEAKGWHNRGYLPHYSAGELLQHVTVHLNDSLPGPVKDRMIRELAQLPPGKQDVERRRRFEQMLDAGYGSCVLGRREVAAIVRDSLHHFHGQRYRLHAWVVMPNHVHFLIRTESDWPLQKLMMSWKSYTGSRIAACCREIGTEIPGGKTWYPEYWDRFIRDERHYAAAVEYIHRNPVAAGLVKRAEEWRWSSASGWTGDLACPEAGRP